MLRLDGVSAFMVYDDIPRRYQHTLKLVVLDWNGSGGEYSYDKLYREMEKWPQRFPMLAWKLANAPLGIHHPVWVQHLEFHLSQHVRRIVCTGKGSHESFCRLVSKLYAQPLNKSLPLWRIWVVEGLEGGKVGLVLLLHHAIADGGGASLLIEGLMNPDKAVEVKTSGDYGVNPNRNPGWFRLLLKGVVDLPVMFAIQLPKLFKIYRAKKQLAKDFAASGKTVPPAPSEAPDSILNAVYTHGRRTINFDFFDLAEFKAMSRHFGVTLNDLLIAVVSGALRRFYISKGQAPESPLVAMIPFNIRTKAQKKEVLGNFVSGGYCWAHVQLKDPVVRLRECSESAKVMKEYQKEVGNSFFIRVRHLAPPFVLKISNWVLKRANGRSKSVSNVTISNVRGPAKNTRVAGGEVVHWVSVGQVVPGSGVNITAWSCVDEFSICLMSDRAVVQDGEEFMGFVRESLEEYREVYQQETAA